MSTSNGSASGRLKIPPVSNFNQVSGEAANQQESQPVSLGASTPRSGHYNRPFAASPDISSVSSTSFDVNSPRKRGRSNSAQENLHSILEAKAGTNTSNARNVHPCRVKSLERTTLENNVSSRLVSLSIRRPLFTDLSKPELNDDSQSVDSNSFSDAAQPPLKKHKQVHMGIDWNLFKPKHKNTIYEHLLNQSDNTVDEAKKWLQLYRNDKRQAVMELIQFFADVCGYQDCNISTLFKYEEENYREFVIFLENHPPKIQKHTGKYLMKASSDWSKQKQNAIFQFIRNLLVISYSTEVLFEGTVITYLLGSVLAFSCSTNRSMRHTAVVFAVKMNTVFIEIQADIDKKVNNYLKLTRVTEHIQEHVDSLQAFKNIVRLALQTLQTIIELNCYFDDPAMYEMIVTCVNEMKNWFKINPSLISSTKYLHKLLKIVSHESKKVRAEALATCYKLIETDMFAEHINPSIKKFLTVVGARIYDIDYAVAIAAVKIFTRMMITYPDSLPVEYFGKIVLLVYQKNYPLAMAAGCFLVELCNKSEYPRKSSTKFIRQLMNLNLASDVTLANLTPLLTEAILYNCDEICDWNIMTDMLLKYELEYHDEKFLLTIMCNAAQQTITGQSKICRSKTYKKMSKIQIQNAEKVSEILLLNLHMLLKKYSNDAQLMLMLTELLLIVNYAPSSLNRSVNEILNALRVLRLAFVKNNDIELLKAVSKVFARWCEETCPFAGQVRVLISTLQQSTVDFILNLMENISETEKGSEDDMLRMEVYLLKLSVLFIDHNVTDLIEDNFLFKEWPALENVLTNKSVKYVISSGYWYLIWKLRLTTENGSKINLQEQIEQLKCNCHKYLKLCFTFMNNSQDVLIRSESFECIYNIHLKFRNELEKPIKFNPLLKELVPAVPEENENIQFMNFAEVLLFKNKNETSLKSRRISLCAVISLTSLKVIPIMELVKLYKYYYLHTDDYGEIFKKGLENIREVNVLGLVGIILQTLTNCFTDVNTSTANAEACDKLTKLARQFQLFVARSAEDTKLILQMGINYALSSESCYQFLYFIKYLSVSLSVTDKEEIMKFLISKVPEEKKSNELITSFVWYLKNVGRGAKSKLMNSTVQDIEYEDTNASMGEVPESIAIDNDSDSN